LVRFAFFVFFVSKNGCQRRRHAGRTSAPFNLRLTGPGEPRGVLAALSPLAGRLPRRISAAEEVALDDDSPIRMIDPLRPRGGSWSLTSLDQKT
jgi:hypothetical protein